MNILSRCLLKIAVLAGGYSLLLLGCMTWPWSGLVLAAWVAWRHMSRRKPRLTTLGSARWAEEEDLLAANMLTAETGLILGRIPVETGLLPGIGKLFSRRHDAAIACQEFWHARRRNHTRVVRIPQAIHTAVFSPSGGGKGVSLVIPFLLTCGDASCVVDFKGENALLTARHRREQFGHKSVLLDPFHVVTNSPDSFNPLDQIAADDPQAIDQCNDLAKALVVRSPDEKDPHFSDAAETWIAAMIATVVRYGDRNGTRSLQTVREFLSHPQRLALAIKLMCESDAWNGMLARLGGQLLHFVDREKSSTLTTVSRHLKFLDSPAIAASTQSSSFDPAGLRTGKMSLFLILPPEHMRAQSLLLRLWISSLLRSVVSGGLQEKRKVHFVLDEAASLGQMDAIEDAVDKYRGYGIRLHFFWQSLGQLKKCFPNGQDQTLLSNTTQIYFGTNDTATADLISTRLGESTIVVDSGGSSTSRSNQTSTGAQLQESASYSTSTNSNWQQVARRLLKPEEVIALPPRVALTFTPGLPPICTQLLRYYEEPNLGRRCSWWRRCLTNLQMFVASLLLALFMLMVASVLSVLFYQLHFSPRTP